MKNYFVGEQCHGIFGKADILQTPKAKFLILFDQWKNRSFYNSHGLRKKTLKID